LIVCNTIAVSINTGGGILKRGVQAASTTITYMRCTFPVNGNRGVTNHGAFHDLRFCPRAAVVIHIVVGIRFVFIIGDVGIAVRVQRKGGMMPDITSTGLSGRTNIVIRTRCSCTTAPSTKYCLDRPACPVMVSILKISDRKRSLITDMKVVAAITYQ
jgi:hypothetical protein